MTSNTRNEQRAACRARAAQVVQRVAQVQGLPVELEVRVTGESGRGERRRK